MKMLTGLLSPSEGKAILFGREVDSQRHADSSPGGLHVAGFLTLF